ncbi:MAG: hypothetical protein LBR84_04330 [Tannerella sp.]|nr:hypothetical protein [Tannerella sp.]
MFSCNMDTDMYEKDGENQDYVCEYDGARPSDSYDYKIVPGTAEWSSLKTGEEMVEACQVPTSLLTSMSTQALVQALWEYPLYLDVLHRYEYQFDFDSFAADNNAYKELITRKDAGKAVLDRLYYVQYPVEDELVSRYKFLELTLAQTKLLSTLTEKETKVLIEKVLQDDKLQFSDKSKSGYVLRPVSWLLIGRTLINAEYQPFMQEVSNDKLLDSYLNDKNFVYLGGLYEDIAEKITCFAKDFINYK